MPLKIVVEAYQAVQKSKLTNGEGVRHREVDAGDQGGSKFPEKLHDPRAKVVAQIGCNQRYRCGDQ